MTNKLVRLRNKTKLKSIKKIITFLIKLFGMDIPENVTIGENVTFLHGGLGVVITGNTVIEDDVIIMQNVTLGAKSLLPNYPKHITIKKGAIISAGSVILCEPGGELIIGEESIIGANAVLLESVGPREIWAGVPARFIKYREDIVEEQD